MNQQGNTVHIDTDEARAGSTPHVVRWVLGISLTLAIIALSLVWIIPALTQGSEVRDETAVVQTMDNESSSEVPGVE